MDFNTYICSFQTYLKPANFELNFLESWSIGVRTLKHSTDVLLNFKISDVHAI